MVTLFSSVHGLVVNREDLCFIVGNVGFGRRKFRQHAEDLEAGTCGQWALPIWKHQEGDVWADAAAIEGDQLDLQGSIDPDSLVTLATFFEGDVSILASGAMLSPEAVNYLGSDAPATV